MENTHAENETMFLSWLSSTVSPAQMKNDEQRWIVISCYGYFIRQALEVTYR